MVLTLAVEVLVTRCTARGIAPMGAVKAPPGDIAVGREECTARRECTAVLRINHTSNFIPVLPEIEDEPPKRGRKG